MKNLLEALIRKGKRHEYSDKAVEYTHFHSSERHIVDGRLGGSTWVQFDTDQDAWYYGIWVDPKGLSTLSYTEGDWTYRIYPSQEKYNEQIKHMLDRYTKAPYMTTLDQDGITHYYQDQNLYFSH